MEKSTVLMGLTFVTLVAGLAWGFYQLWSVEQSKKKGTHTALSERQRPGSTVGNPHATPATHAARNDNAPMA